jgi:hypothetical protein
MRCNLRHPKGEVSQYLPFRAAEAWMRLNLGHERPSANEVANSFSLSPAPANEAAAGRRALRRVGMFILRALPRGGRSELMTKTGIGRRAIFV